MQGGARVGVVGVVGVGAVVSPLHEPLSHIFPLISLFFEEGQYCADNLLHFVFVLTRCETILKILYLINRKTFLSTHAGDIHSGSGRILEGFPFR